MNPGSVEKKMGRMLLADDLSAPLLVIAKHEDSPRVRPAWILKAKKSRVTIILNARHKSSRKVVYARKSPDGLIVDRDGKGIFVWEYMNLDGTPFKFVPKDEPSEFKGINPSCSG